MPKIAKLGIVAGVFAFLLLMFYCFFLNHIDINEIGVVYDAYDGKVSFQNSPGWYFTGPLTEVVALSTLPHQVSIPSGAVIINTKIVRFKPEGVNEFIRLQGFHYSLHESLPNILLGYAFSGKTYPFMEIMQEAGPEQMNSAPLRK